MPGEYKLFSDLVLPYPALLTPNQREKLSILQPKLDALSSFPPRLSNIDVHEAFLAFCTLESASYNPAKRVSELVKPSGSLSSPLGFLFHYPSFTTKHVHDSELADTTNPCIGLIMNKGFTSDNVFWMNSFARRELRNYGEKFNASELYSPETFEAHEAWFNQQLVNLAAQVLVVFGQENHRAITKKFKDHCENLHLWGAYQGVTVRVLYTDQSQFVIERLIVQVHHPEHFYHNWTVEAGITMDAQMNAAAAMAAVQVDKPMYFEDRARNHGLGKADSQPKGFISTVIQLSKMEANDGAIFTWDELPLTIWVEHSFGVTDEDSFWKYYWAEFEKEDDLRVDRDPTDAERLALDTIKAQPVGRLGAHLSRKSLPSIPEIAPFLRKSGFYTSSSKLHEIPEARGGLTMSLNRYLTLPDSKEKKAQNEKKGVGLATAIHRLLSRKAGLESSKRRWSSEPSISDDTDEDRVLKRMKPDS